MNGEGTDYDMGKGQNKQICSLPMLCEVVKYTNCCYLEVFFLYFGHRCIITKSPQYCRPPISTWSRLALPFSSPPWPKLQLPVKTSYVEWKPLKEHFMYFCWTLLKLLFLSSLINEWLSPWMLEGCRSACRWCRDRRPYELPPWYLPCLARMMQQQWVCWS